MTHLVATKFTKHGEKFLSIYRTKDNTTVIEREAVVANLPALIWTNPRSPEDWIALNGPRSQDRWQWE